MAGKLDPVFGKLYDDDVANMQLLPIDFEILWSKCSVLYSHGTGPAPGVAKVYDSEITTHEGVALKVRA